MNITAISNDCILAHFRIFIIVGVAGLLFSHLQAAHGEATTNAAEIILLPMPSSSVVGTIVPEITSTPGIPQIPFNLAPPDTNADDSMNQVGFTRSIFSTPDSLQSILPANPNAGNDSLAGFAMVETTFNPTLAPTIEGTPPVYDSKIMNLKAPRAKGFNTAKPWAEASLGWGDSLVQFFVPFFHPSPPGGQSLSDGDESERPWPVIAGGAASGCSWNEPGLYQAQGFLSFCW